MTKEIAVQVPEFSQEDVKDLKNCSVVIQRSLTNIANNILKIGMALYTIQDKKLYSIQGYKDIYSFAKDKFSISKTSCSNYIGIVEVFGIESKFSATQMIEMLPYVRRGGDISEITPDMSSRQIRFYIKERTSKSSSGAGTDSVAPVRDINPKSFVFNLTEDLFKGSVEVYNSFFADIQTAVINAHKKYGAKSIKIVIE